MKRKRIALVAHDSMKADMIEWAVYNKGTLIEHDLYSTGTTGFLLEKELGVTLFKFKSGPLGGDQQLGARIAYNIPTACNRSTADYLISSPLLREAYTPKHKFSPEEYQQRRNMEFLEKVRSSELGRS